MINNFSLTGLPNRESGNRTSYSPVGAVTGPELDKTFTASHSVEKYTSFTLFLVTGKARSWDSSPYICNECIF